MSSCQCSEPRLIASIARAIRARKNNGLAEATRACGWSVGRLFRYMRPLAAWEVGALELGRAAQVVLSFGRSPQA
jgi:hypothetical protein